MKKEVSGLEREVKRAALETGGIPVVKPGRSGSNTLPTSDKRKQLSGLQLPHL